MTKKSMIFSIVLAATSSALAAGLAVYGGHLFFPPVYLEHGLETKGQNAAPDATIDTDVNFVEIKNIVITLTSEGRANRYMLLDLVVTTDDQGLVDKVNNSIALIKSSTVNLLTNMDYDVLSKMQVSELRQKLLNEYRKDYSVLNLRVPFNDVMISKMVFQ